MTHIQTVLGPVDIDDLGLILPHEHLFIDQRPQEALGQRGGYIDDVLHVMMPYLDHSWDAGVTCLIECTPTGMQDPAVIEALARRTQISIVMPVGLYKQSFPEDKLALSDAEVTDWMVREIGEGIEGSGISQACLPHAEGIVTSEGGIEA